MTSRAAGYLPVRVISEPGRPTSASRSFARLVFARCANGPYFVARCWSSYCSMAEMCPALPILLVCSLMNDRPRGSFPPPLTGAKLRARRTACSHSSSANREVTSRARRMVRHEIASRASTHRGLSRPRPTACVDEAQSREATCPSSSSRRGSCGPLSAARDRPRAPSSRGAAGGRTS